MSAPRETPEHAGYKVIVSSLSYGLVLEDASGKRELWQRNDGHASYGIRFEGHDYEFCRSFKGGYE